MKTRDLDVIKVADQFGSGATIDREKGEGE
jgi:hypothetical protein